MKQTNKMIYDNLLDCVNRAIQAIIDKHYPNGLPLAYYECVPAGFVTTYTITGANIYTGFYPQEKPTKKDIEALNQFRLNFPEYTKDDISLHYKYTYADGIQYSTGATRLKDIPDRYFWNLSDAENKADEIKAKNKHEADLIETGNYVRCERCRKVVLKSESKTSNITGPGRKQVWNSWKNRYDDKAVVTETNMIFCSGQCAGYEQMSREG